MPITTRAAMARVPCRPSQPSARNGSAARSIAASGMACSLPAEGHREVSVARALSNLAPPAGEVEAGAKRALRVRGILHAPGLVESPPHPDRILRCDLSSPRKRGEVAK